MIKQALTILMALFIHTSTLTASELLVVNGSLYLVQDDVYAVVYPEDDEEMTYEISESLVPLVDCTNGTYVLADDLEFPTFTVIEFNCFDEE